MLRTLCTKLVSFTGKYLTRKLQICDVQLTGSGQREFPARSLVFYLSLKHRMLSAGCMDKHETRLNLTTAKCTNTLHGLAPTLRALRATLHHRDM